MVEPTTQSTENAVKQMSRQAERRQQMRSPIFLLLSLTLLLTACVSVPIATGVETSAVEEAEPAAEEITATEEMTGEGVTTETIVVGNGAETNADTGTDMTMAANTEGAEQGLVLHIDEGEVFSSGPGVRAIIKVSPGQHSRHLGVATQEFTGEEQGIPVHIHERDEEVFWVHKGSGTFVLGDRHVPIREGSLVYIPPGTWHGYENEGEETLLVWAISPPHFVDLFRRLVSGEEIPEEELERLFEEHGFRIR